MSRTATLEQRHTAPPRDKNDAPPLSPLTPLGSNPFILHPQDRADADEKRRPRTFGGDARSSLSSYSYQPAAAAAPPVPFNPVEPAPAPPRTSQDQQRPPAARPSSSRSLSTFGRLEPTSKGTISQRRLRPALKQSRSSVNLSTPAEPIPALPDLSLRQAVLDQPPQLPAGLLDSGLSALPSPRRPIVDQRPKSSGGWADHGQPDLLKRVQTPETRSVRPRTSAGSHRSSLRLSKTDSSLSTSRGQDTPSSGQTKGRPRTIAGRPLSSGGPFSLDSGSSGFHRRSKTGVDKPRRPHTSSGPSQMAGRLYDPGSRLSAGDLHDAMLMGERIQSRQARDDIAALVDFLRNYPPPVDNFMSQPSHAEEDDERGRWAKIKNIGKRSRSVPQEPQTLQLPDSAVAGMTTGGHRHIAISIPLEAAPFTDDRSQYPVYNRDMQMGSISKEAVRTFKNDNGVITVLRPVTEAYEAPSDKMAKSKFNSSIGRPRTARGKTPPPVPPPRPNTSMTNKPHDYIGALSTNIGTPLLEDKTAPWSPQRAPSPAHRSSYGHHSRSHSAFNRAVQPRAGSRLPPSRPLQVREPASIDGLLNSSMPSSVLTRGRYYTETKPLPLTPSDSMSSISDNDAREAPVNGNHSFKPRKDSLRPKTSSSVKSRKDLVREKKMRDIEAMWSASAKPSKKVENGSDDQDASDAKTEQATNGHKRHASQESQKSVKLTMSSMMIVADVEPEECTTTESKRTSVQPTPPPDSTESPDVRSLSPEMQLVARNGPVMPTPPTSTQGSPQQRHSAEDRTSLTRRREWKAMREQERKAREAMAIARTKAQQLATGSVTYDLAKATGHTDKEVMRLYEAYREHRLREMDRRLRRLERNGDVWLKALVPVLDNMNRSMAAANEQPLEDATREWASDNEATGEDEAERVGRRMSKRRLTRRTSMSQARLLEKLTGATEDSWSDSVSRSDDTSGMAAVEPLMRELAGQSKQWHGQIHQSPVVTGSSQFF